MTDNQQLAHEIEVRQEKIEALLREIEAVKKELNILECAQNIIHTVMPPLPTPHRAQEIILRILQETYRSLTLKEILEVTDAYGAVADYQVFYVAMKTLKKHGKVDSTKKGEDRFAPVKYFLPSEPVPTSEVQND